MWGWVKTLLLTCFSFCRSAENWTFVHGAVPREEPAPRPQRHPSTAVPPACRLQGTRPSGCHGTHHGVNITCSSSEGSPAPSTRRCRTEERPAAAESEGWGYRAPSQGWWCPREPARPAAVHRVPIHLWLRTDLPYGQPEQRLRKAIWLYN